LMAMLDRYRKPGGFLQLLNLIETSGLQKQQKFLDIVREEDPRWAEVIAEKLLSMQKICAWNNEALMEVVANLQILSLAIMMHGLEEQSRDKFTTAMSNSQRRSVMEQYNASQPTPAEISTTFARVITDVRKMITEGRLRMEKVDPSLVVEEGIEDALRKPTKAKESLSSVSSSGDTKIEYESSAEFHSANPESNGPASGTAGGGGVPSSSEIILLKKKLTVVIQENQTLKQELLRLRGKLDQIKKIA